MKSILIFLIGLLMMSSLVSANEKLSWDYRAEIVEVTASPTVVHTIYPGMSVSDLKANFENLPSWTFTEHKYNEPGLPAPDARQYRITKNWSNSDSVYEAILVDTDGYTVKGSVVQFYVCNQGMAKFIFSEATKNFIKVAGQPANSRRDDSQTLVNTWFKPKEYNAHIVVREFTDREIESVNKEHSFPHKVLYCVIISRDGAHG